MDETEVGHDTVAETANSVLTLVEMEVEERLILRSLTVVQLKVNLFEATIVIFFETVGTSEANSLLLVIDGTSAARPALPLHAATRDTNNGVEEWEAQLDVQVVERVHRSKHLLGVNYLRSFHFKRNLL